MSSNSIKFSSSILIQLLAFNLPSTSTSTRVLSPSLDMTPHAISSVEESYFFFSVECNTIRESYSAVPPQIGGSELLELEHVFIAEQYLLKVRGVLVQLLFLHFCPPKAIVDLLLTTEPKYYWLLLDNCTHEFQHPTHIAIRSLYFIKLWVSLDFFCSDKSIYGILFSTELPSVLIYNRGPALTTVSIRIRICLRCQLSSYGASDLAIRSFKLPQAM